MFTCRAGARNVMSRTTVVPAHLKLPRNRFDGAIILDEQIEHPSARGMTDCPKDILLAIGSHYHVANIRKRWLTCQAELSFVKGIGRGGPTLRPQPVAAWHRAAQSAAGSPRTPERKSSFVFAQPRLLCGGI